MKSHRTESRCRVLSPKELPGKGVLFRITAILLAIGVALSGQSTFAQSLNGLRKLSISEKPLKRLQPQTNSGLAGRRTNAQAEKLVERAAREWQNGNLKGALASVLSVRRIDPYLVSTYQMEAQIAHDLGDKKGYLASLSAILSANPQSGSLNNAVGKLYMQVDEIEKGLQSLERAVKLSPHKPQYATDLAAAYVSRKYTDAAIQMLTKVLKKNPQEKSLLISLAQLHESTANWTQASLFYERAVRKNENNSFCLRQLGRCQYYLKEFKESAKLYAACLTMQNSYLNSADYIRYGDACLRNGDYTQAQRIFDEVGRHDSRPSPLGKLHCSAVCAPSNGEKRPRRKELSSQPSNTGPMTKT
jgi:tetratricopeptide (TPR) repeat protein